jgi:hypothetical protein
LTANGTGNVNVGVAVAAASVVVVAPLASSDVVENCGNALLRIPLRIAVGLVKARTDLVESDMIMILTMAVKETQEEGIADGLVYSGLIAFCRSTYGTRWQGRR